eukprot:SAG11_NODE_1151_length_5668_cov_6.748070_3_plen_81_part_00
MISKLNRLRCIVDPVVGTEHAALSDEAAAYWRDRVDRLCDATALAARVAKVPDTLDFYMLLKDNIDLATLRHMQATRQVQ